ncbi:hypothetical protein IM697_09810 [Streptomyces ferrugineus]|uniref:Uncharacterized protein n=1 Tax=Streptomyces ferrugineus TaxID=1413221 RepID=A0A7M2SQK3_9ACTN|nr:hypothetical protein [Streptomyces ferrugineus]QOV38640.1 hypothetical protein IM697_09810 [Streptomyces ferrugineus]
MALEFLGSSNTSQGGGCPSFYRDTETGDIIVQGLSLTDPDKRAQLLKVKPGEDAVVVPVILFDLHAAKVSGA